MTLEPSVSWSRSNGISALGSHVRENTPHFHYNDQCVRDVRKAIDVCSERQTSVSFNFSDEMAGCLGLKQTELVLSSRKA
jgi:hypothetical protein